MAKTTSKSDKKLKKAIEKREPGEWSLKWANPFAGTAGECDCDSVWQTKENTHRKAHSLSKITWDTDSLSEVIVNLIHGHMHLRS